jgi:hypothetical protein
MAKEIRKQGEDVLIFKRLKILIVVKDHLSDHPQGDKYRYNLIWSSMKQNA